MPSFCSYFNSNLCRSCESIEDEYPKQIQRKEEVLQEALCFFPLPRLEPSVRSPIQGFRNRVKMMVTGTVQDPVIGLTGKESLDEGQELLECPIHHPKLNELMQAMPEFIRDYQLIPYQIQERKGELKGLIAFYAPGENETTGQMYLRFVLRSKECVSRIQKLFPALQARFPHLQVVSANLQPIPHAILEGPEEIFITQKKTIDYRLGAYTLQLSPQAFVQTNTVVATQLYQTAARWVEESKSEKLLELFCGQGAFSFFSASFVQEAIGIEINEDAIKTANETAALLGLKHLRFIATDAAQMTHEMQAFSPDLILVNPPRRGLGKSIEWIQKSQPKHLIYSSCAVDTLAMDLKKLESTYRVKKIQLFDLFPHTEHFETLVWLEKI